MHADERSPLAEYARRRAFDRTPEPPPSTDSDRDGPLLFVVQQHAARRLHFDFRLEVDGVLRSWAVPRGLPSDPADRRLAVATEDHPFDYGSFEGVIPAGQYGAGRVIVWDCGFYSPDDDGRHEYADRAAATAGVRAALAKGKLSFFLRGQKLKGSFALVRTKRIDGWLMLRHRDGFTAPPSSGDAEASPVSGRTIKDIAVRPPTRIDAALLAPCGPAEPVPQRMAPMLAAQATGGSSSLPDFGEEWRFEPKLDGYRVLACVDRDVVRLLSRNGIDYAARLPAIVAALRAQHLDALVLDGELVALDARGRPSFSTLQNSLQDGATVARTVLFAFDLLHLAGRNLRDHSWADRRRWLEQTVLPDEQLQVVHVSPDGPLLHQAAVDAGFEGVMAKRTNAPYRAGRRSDDWRKIKVTRTDEFVVGGYTSGNGARAGLGALLVGVREGRRLRYAGHVGSGFDLDTLVHLRARLATLRTRASPFTDRPSLHAPTTWVKPRLVVEVQFAEWTRDGHLRAPVFLRIRDDRVTTPAHRDMPLRKVSAQSPLRRPRAAGTATGDDAASGAEGGILAQLAALPSGRATLEAGGERIALSHLDRVYWPPTPDGQAGLTKRDLLAYLVRMHRYMLPHLANRPLTMIRMPDGIGGERFFQKHWGQAMPPFVQTIEVWSGSKAERQRYILCNNLPTLLWLGQVGTLEFHVWHSRASTAPDHPPAGTDFASSGKAMDRSLLNFPDFLVFDLDPYIYSGREKKGEEPELNERAFATCREVAFHLRDLVVSMGLVPFVKTSGKTGLHIFAPIVRTLDFAAARSACEAIGAHLMRQHPAEITMQWSVVKRTGRIFMDHNMNVRGKTLNAAYSPRGVPAATVAMPLDWDELAHAHPEDFTLRNAPARLQRTGDRWRDLLTSRVSFEAALAGSPDSARA